MNVARHKQRDEIVAATMTHPQHPATRPSPNNEHGEIHTAVQTDMDMGI